LENLFLFLYHIRLLSFSCSQVYKQIKFLQPDHSGARFEEQTNLAAVIAIYDDWNDNYQIYYRVTFYEILTSILRNEQVQYIVDEVNQTEAEVYVLKDLWHAGVVEFIAFNYALTTTSFGAGFIKLAAWLCIP